MYKLINKTLALSSTFLASTVISNAAIGFAIAGEDIRDKDGLLAPASTLFLLVADTKGDGFGSIDGTTTSLQAGTSLGINSYLVGNPTDKGVMVVHRGDLSGGGEGFAFDFVSLSLGSGWTENNSLALLWFPEKNLTTSEAELGSQYGFYTDPLGVDGSEPWTTPSDGTLSYSLNFLTDSRGGSNPDSAGNATLTVVPEPAAAGLLLGLGVLGFLVLRRRRK